ncbi:MAG: decaprenyl-phosphate phosphoribosyltransferase [Endomicrobiales bacterium]|jgi:4-hydroxybenzoate polyprenyltransferase
MKHLIISLRPRQWIKNLFLLAGILFSRHLFDPAFLEVVISAFVVFCLLSGAVYLLNDVKDIENDKNHPRKSLRPIAADLLSKKAALVSFYVITALSLGVAFLLGMPFFLTAVGYFILQVAYTLFLKDMVILDVFSIAAGFVLRVIAGAVVINVVISPWLVICTTLLALFLGLSKRRHEIETLLETAHTHRTVLQSYSTYLLDQMIGVVTASAVVCYALYTMAPETVARFNTRNLLFTIPFVLYGIFRYLFLIHKKGEGGNPETVLTADLPLLIDIVLWALTAGFIIYR